MIENLALLACLLLTCLSIFQLALIGGVPLGEYAWGGASLVLPTKLRIGSAVAIVLYGMFALIILDKAGLLNIISSATAVNIGIWVIVGYLFIGVLANLASKSKRERIVMTPIALVLALLFLAVALN